MSEHITVVGTIVTDPERRRTGGGVPVVNFRLASTTRRRDDATGAWVDGHTNWYSVSAYRGLAENALASLRKGQRVIAIGAFRVREWESGGRQGVSAEIDAVALGHDLLWGTSQYTRGDRAASAGIEGASASHNASVTPITDDNPRAQEATSARAGDSDRAPADAWARPLVDELTPF